MPTLDSWPEPMSMRGSPPEGEPTATGAFENISELALRGCLVEADIIPLKQAVRESLPAPPVDSARYLSGVYLEEGSTDLLPGMRLRIGTAHFANNTAEKAVVDLTLVPGDRVEWLPSTASLKIL